jgi:hypothetical protein
MFTNVRSVYGFLGVALFLVALYLILEHAGGASQVITAGAGAGSQFFKTLQGR